MDDPIELSCPACSGWFEAAFVIDTIPTLLVIPRHDVENRGEARDPFITCPGSGVAKALLP